MFAALWLKIEKWVAALGAIIVAIGAAFLYGRYKQKDSDKASAEKLQEQQVQAVDKINQQNADVRSGVEDMIHGLPPATPGTQVPAQTSAGSNPTNAAVPNQVPEIPVKIADANPDSSTGRLRDWSRDSSPN